MAGMIEWREKTRVALKQKKNEPIAPPKPLEFNGKQLWELPPEEEEGPFLGGPGAVLHKTGAKGRRSALFPKLNITATAKQLGITKSHLAKVLAGVNRPSIELAVRLAEVLGTDINVIVSLYQAKPIVAAPVNNKKRRKQHVKSNH